MITTDKHSVGSLASSPSQANFLSARDNPLCIRRVSQVAYRFAQYDWPWQLARLQALGYRAAIVGHQGSGKTTLLYELARQLDQHNIANRHVYLPPESFEHRRMIHDAITGSRTGELILVDGIERLSFCRRQQLLVQTKRGTGLVVAVHQACRLPTWIHCRTSAGLMTSVLLDLGLDHPRVLSAGQVAFKNSAGNVREALRELYDQFAAGRFNDILSR